MLTFAGAFMISIQVYVNSMRNANRNIFEMTEKFRSRLDEVQYQYGKLQRHARCLDEEFAQRVGSAMHRAEVPLRDAVALLHKLDTNRHDGRSRLRTRAKFVLTEDLVKQGLEKAENAMAALREVANEGFSE